MLQFIRVYIVCAGNKDVKIKYYNMISNNYNLTPLDIYNGQSQIYCIKQEEIMHLKQICPTIHVNRHNFLFYRIDGCKV